MIPVDILMDFDEVITAVSGIRGYHPAVRHRLTREDARDVLPLDEQRLPGLIRRKLMEQNPTASEHAKPL